MPRRTDNLLASIGSLYLAMVIFVSIYGYVGVSLFLHNQAVSNLVVVDKFLALRYLANPSGYEMRDARLSDLPHFFLEAAHQQIQDFVPAPDPDEPADSDEPRDRHERLKPESGRVDSPLSVDAFTDAKIEGSYVLKIPMRLAAGGTCDVLVTQLAPGRDFSISVPFKSHTIKSENIRLIKFSGCTFASVLSFSLEDREFAFAVPESEFPTIKASRPFEAIVRIFREIEEVKKLLPAPIAMYVKHELDGSFVTMHLAAIESYVLSYANSRLGKFFPAHELEKAAQNLYEEKERDASYFGVSASSSLLVRLGPLAYFALSFVLWRRVRQLPVGRIRTERYWFGLDTRDWVGRYYAYVCGCVPLLFGILIYALFSVALGIGLRVFDRFVTLKGIVTLQIEYAPLFDETMSPDHFATVLGLILLPLQFLISLATVRKLVRVINANSQRNRPRGTASGPA